MHVIVLLFLSFARFEFNVSQEEALTRKLDIAVKNNRMFHSRERKEIGMVNKLWEPVGLHGLRKCIIKNNNNVWILRQTAIRLCPYKFWLGIRIVALHGWLWRDSFSERSNRSSCVYSVQRSWLILPTSTWWKVSQIGEEAIHLLLKDNILGLFVNVVYLLFINHE